MENKELLLVNNKLKLMQKIAKVSHQAPVFAKNSEAKVKTKTGSQYSYQYVSLDDIQKPLKDILNANQLYVSFDCYHTDGVTSIDMVVTDLETGEVDVTSTSTVLDSKSMQDVMAYYTYNKRYMLVGKFNLILEDEDNDGKGVKIKNTPNIVDRNQEQEFEYRHNEAKYNKWEVTNLGKDKFKPVAQLFNSIGGGYHRAGDGYKGFFFYPKTADMATIKPQLENLIKNK
jgi:hypothetical protein